jgi:hypothetical protein
MSILCSKCNRWHDTTICHWCGGVTVPVMVNPVIDRDALLALISEYDAKLVRCEGACIATPYLAAILADLRALIGEKK